MGIKGGARPGAGRKKGSVNAANLKRNQMVATAVAGGLLPLEFMLRELRSKAPKNATAVQLAAHRVWRMEAAKNAAPYIHPRLSTTALTADVAHTVRILSDFDD
jgi:hypothetical protein